MRTPTPEPTEVAPRPGKPIGPVESVGPDNRSWLQRHAGQTAKGVVAWGNGGHYPRPELPPHPGGWWHLGTTQSGEPKHPLARGKHFIPYDQALTEYRHVNRT